MTISRRSLYLMLFVSALVPSLPAVAQDAHPPEKTEKDGAKKDGAEKAAPAAEKGTADSKDKETGLRILSLSERCYAAVAPASGANAGFVVGDESVAVIDTLGTPERAKLLLAEIRKITKKPVRHLVYTHWHLDHTAGGKEFPDGVTIHGTAATTKAIAGNLKKFRELTRAGMKGHGGVAIPKVVLPSKTVKGEAKLDLGGVTLHLLEAGHAHSKSDLAAWVTEEKVLFVGDLVSAGLHPSLAESRTFHWIAALAQLEGLKAEKVVPGTGEPGEGKLLNDQQQYLMTLRRAVKHLLKRGASLNDILTKFKVPKEWEDLGNAKVWDDNLAYLIQEMVDEG